MTVSYPDLLLLERGLDMHRKKKRSKQNYSDDGEESCINFPHMYPCRLPAGTGATARDVDRKRGGANNITRITNFIHMVCISGGFMHYWPSPVLHRCYPSFQAAKFWTCSCGVQGCIVVVVRGDRGEEVFSNSSIHTSFFY